MVKTVQTIQKLKNSELLDGKERKKNKCAGDQDRNMWSKIGKVREVRKGMAVRHSCTGNGPEWGDCETENSDDSMEMSQESTRSKNKRGSEFDGINAKKARNLDELRGRQEERNQESMSYKIVLRFGEGNGISSMNPIKLTTILKNQVGDICMAKVLRDGNLLIVCKNEEQRGKAKKIKEIGKYKVLNVSNIGEGSKWTKGVIWGIPIGINLDDIKSNMRGGKIKEVRRLQTTRDGTRSDSEGIMIVFDEERLPTRVTLGYMNYRVREYIPNPVRCYNCQRFGHVAKVCKGKKRCARCGENHGYEECNVNTQPKCCNCGGNHSVAYGGCAIMKREREIQQIKTKDKITYAEAVKRVNQKGGAEGGSGMTRQNMEVQEEMNEKKTLIDVKKLVTFIAGVINATMEIKSKTERIQIIVKAAVHHLEVSELTWEEVRNNLNAQASQDNT